MTASIARVAYHSTVREMPSDERPRERLEHYGAASLQTAELLAIIRRVGTAQENVIELSSRLLRLYGGLGGLLAVDFAKLCREHGLGQAKAAQLKAALEIGRRLSVLAPAERPQITQPADIANLVRFNMGDSLPCAIWSAPCTQPQVTPSSIWPLQSRSRTATWNSLRSPARSAPVLPNRWSSCSTEPAGTPMCTCGCPSTFICS